MFDPHSQTVGKTPEGDLTVEGLPEPMDVRVCVGVRGSLCRPTLCSVCWCAQAHTCVCVSVHACPHTCASAGWVARVFVYIRKNGRTRAHT